jgi:hypothetical protein
MTKLPNGYGNPHLHGHWICESDLGYSRPSHHNIESTEYWYWINMVHMLQSKILIRHWLIYDILVLHQELKKKLFKFLEAMSFSPWANWEENGKSSYMKNLKSETEKSASELRSFLLDFIEKLSTIDHCGSRCKGWLGPPLTYIL